MTSNLQNNSFPILKRINDLEAQAIASTFRLYDYRATGVVPKHLIKKLVKALGVDIPYEQIQDHLTLNELLIMIDHWVSEPANPLACALEIFDQLAGEKAGNLQSQLEDNQNSESDITVKSIQSFIESLGRPAVSTDEAKLLLTLMSDYDDCSDNPSIKLDVFKKQISLYARKNNMLKSVSNV